MVKPVKAKRPQPALAIRYHIIGKYGIGQHGHMSKNIVKHIRLLQIIRLFRRPDNISSREPPIGKVVEKYGVWYKARYSDYLPARCRH